MDSEPKPTLKDLRRRLRVLEGAFGINLDLSPCSGDPMNCPSDPCNEERCPIRQNVLQDLHHRFARIEDEVRFLRNFADELVMEIEGIPLTINGIAQLRVKRDKAMEKLTEIEKIVPPGDTGPVAQLMSERRERLKKEIEEADHQIGQMRRGEIG